MTFDEWFKSKQGEPYDSMYVFARDAWKSAKADAFKLAAERARDLGQELAEACDALFEDGDWESPKCCAKYIRSGEWKKNL